MQSSICHCLIFRLFPSTNAKSVTSVLHNPPALHPEGTEGSLNTWLLLCGNWTGQDFLFSLTLSTQICLVKAFPANLWHCKG